MPGPDLILDAPVFIPSNDTTVWLAEIPRGKKYPDYPVTVPFIVAAGATTNVSAFSFTVFKGFPLKLLTINAGPPLVVTNRLDLLIEEDAAVGEIMTFAPARAAISGANYYGYQWIPIYSARSANIDQSTASATGSNFRTIWDESTVGSRSWRVAMSGLLDTSDPAYSILRKYNQKIGNDAYIYIMLLFADGSSYEGRASVADLRMSGSKDNFVELSWTFVGSGTLAYDKYNFF